MKAALNYIGLLLGYFLGQGSFFLAQTYLAINEKYSLVGELTVGLGIVSLVMLVCDLGGTYLAAKTVNEAGYVLLIDILAWIVCRLLIFYPVCYVFDGFFNLDLVGGWLFVAGFIWCFNLTGYVDALQKNTIGGCVLSLNYLFLSLYLLYPGALEKEDDVYVGGFYCLGMLATVVAQFLIVYPNIVFKISGFAALVKKAINRFNSGLFFSLNAIANQGYGRFVQWLALRVLGADVAGQYMYLRNIFLFGCQFVGFSIRVDLPKTKKIDRTDVLEVAKCFNFVISTTLIMSCFFVVLLLLPFLKIIDLIHLSNEAWLMLLFLPLSSMMGAMENYYLMWGRGVMVSFPKFLIYGCVCLGMYLFGGNFIVIDFVILELFVLFLVPLVWLIISKATSFRAGSYV